MSNADLTDFPAGRWNILPAARVAPLECKQVPLVARLSLWIIRGVEKTNEDYNVFGTLARLGTIFPAHAIFLSQLLKRGQIPAAIRAAGLRLSQRGAHPHSGPAPARLPPR